MFKVIFLLSIFDMLSGDIIEIDKEIKCHQAVINSLYHKIEYFSYVRSMGYSESTAEEAQGEEFPPLDEIYNKCKE